LATLGVGARPQIEPLGRLVGVRSARRLVVLRDDGRVFASTQLPRPLKRADVVSSALAADARGRAVAFTPPGATPPTARAAANSSTC
jgi:hypothetical protein